MKKYIKHETILVSAGIHLEPWCEFNFWKMKGDNVLVYSRSVPLKTFLKAVDEGKEKKYLSEFNNHASF